MTLTLYLVFKKKKKNRENVTWGDVEWLNLFLGLQTKDAVDGNHHGYQNPEGSQLLHRQE